MEFQRLLLQVGQALNKDEVKALAFLCTDLLGRNPTTVDSASDLFNRLEDQDHLSPEEPRLLTELLLMIQRPRLVRDLNLLDQESITSRLISPYRKLLYNLSEQITDDDLKHMKFLLNKTLPRRKLEENVTTLEVFLEMEHMDLLSDTNLDKLETIIKTVCPMLNDKINQFKARQAMESLSLSSIFYSNTSVATTSLTVRSDALGSSPFQENNNISKEERFQTTNPTSEVLGTYPMTAAKRGICLIINNYDFSNSNLKNREGTKTDERSLSEVFKWLGFEIKIKNDCTSKGMLSELQDLGRRDHGQMDCVVCCILSHGEEGGVYGVDGDSVKLWELMESLNGLKCPSLAEKPKLFFIQACQGTSEQRAVYTEADGPVRGRVCSDAVTVKGSIPSDADFLQAMATVPSFVSFRERKNGTWFIQSLCQNLVKMVPGGCDLVSILTRVNADVSQRTDFYGEKKQMPQPSFSLRKKVVFPVPKAPPPSLPSV